MSEANLNELYHHGILGMKWGKKNGPPYPLDYKKLSAEERAAAKDKAIRQGNIKEAASNIDYYDNNELRAVKERFSLNQDIAKLNASTIKTGKQKAADIVESFSRGLKRATDAGEAGIKAYNFMAKAMNSFSDEDSQLPLIGEKKPHRNKAEGKTKGQMAEMLRKGNLSTKDYEDIKNRLNAMNEAESGIRKQRSYSKEDIEDIFDNPTRYSKESLKEAADAAVNFNKIANTTWYKERENVREERRESEREEKDYWGFYHSAEFQDELMHRRKGQENKKHKYTKKEKLDSGKYRYYYETGRNYTQMANDLTNLVNDETNQFIDLAKQQKENYDNSVVDRQVTVKRFPFKDKQVNRKVKVSKSQAQKEAATKVANARTQHKKTVQKSYSDMESQKRMAASAYNKHQQTSKSYKVKASMATKINKAKAWLRKKNIQKIYAVDAYGWRNRKTNEYVNLGAGFIKKYLSINHSYENELYHHGVDGMKWGKRNGPPYPLDKQGKAELRAQKKAAKAERKELGKQVEKTQEYKNNKKVNALRAHDRLLRDGRIGAFGGAAAGAAIGGLTGATVGLFGGMVAATISSATINAGRKYYENSKYKNMKVSELMEKKNKPKLSTDEVNKIGKEYLKFAKKRDSFSSDERKDLWEEAYMNANNPNHSEKQRTAAKQLAQRIEQVEKSEKTYKSPNNGKYDLSFLEAIQNSEMLALGDHKSMDTEYEKYKADPEYYWKVRSNQIKQMY